MTHNRSQQVRGLVLLAVLGTILCGILFVVQVLPDYTRRQENPYQETWSLESREHTVIQIDLTSVNIQMQSYDGEEIQVSFDGQYLSRQKDAAFPLTVTMEKGTLKIQEKNPETQGKINFGPWDFNALQGTLTVLLPRGDYGKVSIESFSGNVSIESLEAAALTVDTSSGRLITDGIQVEDALHLESFSGSHDHRNLQAEGCTIASSSGSITLSGGEFDSLKIDTFSGRVEASDLEIARSAVMEGSSGSVTVEKLQADSLRCKTFSGNVTLGDCKTGQLSVETSSGKVQAQLPEMPEETEIETFSGSVTLTLPGDAEFTCTTDTFSGTVAIDYPSVSKETSSGNAHVVGDGKERIHISTSSGNITVKP